MNKEQLEQLKQSIDDESIKLFKSILLAKANIETIKPIAIKCYEEAFNFVHPDGCKYSELAQKRRDKSTMTEYNHQESYLLDDSEFQSINFYERAYKNFCKEGIKPSKKDNCPLLEAEDILRANQRAFVKHRLNKLTFLGITFNMLRNNYDNYKEFLSINEKYLINFI